MAYIHVSRWDSALEQYAAHEQSEAEKDIVNKCTILSSECFVLW